MQSDIRIEERWRTPSGRLTILTATARFVRRQPVGALGALILLALATAASIGPLFVQDPLAFDLSAILNGPSISAPFGTDEKGRDVFARTISGMRVSFQVAAVGSCLGVSAGLLSGVFTGYIGGRIDGITQRIVDSFLAFPALLLAMAFAVSLGRSEGTVTLAIAVLTWPPSSRVIRSGVLTQSNMLYIEAARSIGAGTGRIVTFHLMPNIVSIYIVLVTSWFAQALLLEAALSFLGAGVPPPRPSLGGMVFQAQQYAVVAPWVAVFPGATITLIVFAVSLFGDALRDALDPRLRTR